MGRTKPDIRWNVIFDLDGTLIDSQGDIVDCLQRAFNKTGQVPAQPLEGRLIGPPLTDLVDRLTPDASTVQRQQIVQEFRKLYDTSDYPQTHAMPGADALLSELWKNQVATFIATNKVEKPTRRILDRLGWRQFRDVLASDSVPGMPLNKPQILNTISIRWTLDPLTTWVVGDSASDILSARINGFHSAAYSQGYGDPKALKDSQPDVWLDHLQDFAKSLTPHELCESTEW